MTIADRPARRRQRRCRSATCACAWTAGTSSSPSASGSHGCTPRGHPRAGARFTTDAESDPNQLDEAINRYGVIGHAQTSARARRRGKPLIIRRDFNTIDGGQAGLHFVSIQRTIEDFITTRNAMNATVGPTSEPRDHRHRQQRHQRVHLRPQTRQLHPPAAQPTLLPATTRTRTRSRLRGGGSPTAGIPGLIARQRL